jgi:hypothetical protein
MNYSAAFLARGFLAVVAPAAFLARGFLAGAATLASVPAGTISTVASTAGAVSTTGAGAGSAVGVGVAANSASVGSPTTAVVVGFGDRLKKITPAMITKNAIAKYSILVSLLKFRSASAPNHTLYLVLMISFCVLI